MIRIGRESQCLPYAGFFNIWLLLAKFCFVSGKVLLCPAQQNKRLQATRNRARDTSTFF